MAAEIHLAELLGKLHAVHRKAAIENRRQIAELARRIVAKRWPGAEPDQLRHRESEQRRRLDRHFRRRSDRRDAWALALAELTKHAPARVDVRTLAEYVGRVNAGVGLDLLPDGLKEVAAVVAGLDQSFAPVLLAKLAREYPARAEEFRLCGPPQPSHVVDRANVQPAVPKPVSELDILSVKQAAKAANVSEKTIKRLIKSKRLNAVPYGTGTRKNYKIVRGDLAAVAGEATAADSAGVVMRPPRPRRRPAASSGSGRVLVW